MSSVDRLRRLFDYDSWANQKVLDVITEHEGFAHYDKALSLFCHILAAEELWYRRVTGTDLSGFEVWPDHTLSEVSKMNADFPPRWQALLSENEDTLDRSISYKNTSGTAYDTSLSDILHHLVIHGQHHRAQIASLLRDVDIAPPATDFIFYTRRT